MNCTKLGYWLFAIAIVFQSCQPTTSAPVAEMEKPFFDLKSYFNQEKKRLATVSNFTKTTVVDGKEETKKIAKLDFDKELRIFVEADINKPAWIDKYEVDSVLQAGNLTKISYIANDKKLAVREIVVDFDKQKIAKISIKKAAETALADTQFQLIYEPERGYSIENTQQLTVGEDKAFLVKVQF